MNDFNKYREMTRGFVDVDLDTLVDKKTMGYQVECANLSHKQRLNIYDAFNRLTKHEDFDVGLIDVEVDTEGDWYNRFILFKWKEGYKPLGLRQMEDVFAFKDNAHGLVYFGEIWVPVDGVNKPDCVVRTDQFKQALEKMPRLN